MRRRDAAAVHLRLHLPTDGMLQNQRPPHSKWPQGTNLAFVSYAADADAEMVIALGAVDNLGKGAAGQAVQNMNLMLGCPEQLGLELVPMLP